MLIACGVSGPAAAEQTTTAPNSRGSVQTATQAVGGARMTLETRVTRGAPYSAETLTEFVQMLPDGNRIVRRTTTRVSRDGEGRLRRETIADNGEATDIVINDPVAGVSFVLNPATRTAWKSPGMFARIEGGRGAGGRGSAMMVYPPSAAADERVRVIVSERVSELAPTLSEMSGKAGAPHERQAQTAREDLGQQTIEGVATAGTRTTKTLPAGAIGNELPIVTTSEQWYSRELDLLLLTRHNDPRMGETTYRLSNVSRAEPDRTLFQVPPDYTVREPMKRAPMMEQ